MRRGELSTPVALVVEDDETIREALVSVLELEGYRAHAAETLAQAREHLEWLRPTVVVLDRGLPDGLVDDLLEELSEKTSPPPTVLVSASPGAPTVAAQFGISFVAKPFDLEGLMAAIAGTIRDRRHPSKPPPAAV